ncbi:MAG TPA: xanthine dehydrogenase family protein molybdopterin-binding subunit [Pseudonocardiaceae bacterium]|jgi:carbon-monoxide dehydrogenase large subunit|nr:xanthine dehydrogenase family protein molybdopterin-binding subunit [Pseudonocardiaceae bacterium]
MSQSTEISTDAVAEPAPAAKRVFGAAILPREDPAFIRGDAKFTADLTPPHTLHMQLLRSDFGHAEIVEIDTAKAKGMPGVVAVITGKDIAEAMMPLPCIWIPGNVESRFPPHPYGVPGAGSVLAIDRVRYIGDPVAAVVAETPYQARDAIDAIRVTYHELPAVIDPREAVKDGAPQLHEAVPNNLNSRWTCGDEESTDEAIEEADVVVELDLTNQRTINCAIEPRAAIGEYDPVKGEYVLHATSQSPHNHRFLLSALVLGIPFNKLRVIAPHIGGSFGSKGYLYADMPLVLFLAKQLGRPVKWVDDRNGMMRSTVHGRDQTQHVTLAGTSDGQITAVKAISYANIGAYPSTIGPGAATSLMGRSIPGPYAIEHGFCAVHTVFTNVVPLGAQRGSGRAEANYLMERLVDRYAEAIGMDPAQVRLRNMIEPDQFPYDNGLGWTYDSGDYPRALELALRNADYYDFPARRAEAARHGKLLGIGISSYVAVCGVGPSTRMSQEGMLGGTWESGNVRVHPNGEVAITIGSKSTGQSHETVFAQIVADVLGIDVDTVAVYHSDTEKAPYGQGTYGSRSYSVGGPAIQGAASKILAKMRQAAAWCLKADESELDYQGGVFSVRGRPEDTKSFQDISMMLWYGWNLPPGMAPALDETTFFDPTDFNYPFGSHVAVVEIDEISGEVRVIRYVAVNDSGRIGNPIVVRGQVEGSIVHGLGQALMEQVDFDEHGRLHSDDFRGYAIPRATDVPTLELDFTETPSPHNPLGVKGAGETATVPAASAISNAICNALGACDIDIDMPITPEKIWRFLQRRKAGQ